MNLSLMLSLEAPYGPGRPTKSAISRLGDDIIRSALRAAHTSSSEDDKNRLDILRGKPITRERTNRLVQRYDSVAEVAIWPLQLLCMRMLSKEDVMRQMRPYEIGHSSYDLFFPKLPRQVLYEFPCPSGYDGAVTLSCAESLIRRRDVYGFFGFLAQYRLSGATRETDDQCSAARYLVRALPGACIHPYVRPHASSLISATKEVLKFLPTYVIPVRFDEACVWRLIDAGTPYVEGKTEDPLIHYQLKPCPADRATLLLGSG